MSNSLVDQAFYAEEAAKQADKAVELFERQSGLAVFQRVAFEGSQEDLPEITVSTWRKWLELRIAALDKWITAATLNPFSGLLNRAVGKRNALQHQLETENFPPFLVED
jgi:hypothetical protein